MTLIVPDHALDAMRRHGEAEYPHEACGVLVGRIEGDRRVVSEALPVANLNVERPGDRYELDPHEYASIEQRADREGLAVLGIWHTHPDHPSKASETDRQRAADVWDDLDSWSYLILSIIKGQLAEWSSWVLRDRTFHGEPVEVLSAREITP